MKLPKTFTFKIRNPEYLKKMEGGKMVDNVRIRHKGLAKQGLANPIKYRVSPNPKAYDAMFDEKGEAEVPRWVADRLLIQDGYEKVDTPEVINVEVAVEKQRKPKVENEVEGVSTEKEFIKQITG